MALGTPALSCAEVHDRADLQSYQADVKFEVFQDFTPTTLGVSTLVE